MGQEPAADVITRGDDGSIVGADGQRFGSAPDVIPPREFLEMELLFWMLGFAYLFAVIPAWWTAGMDLALSAKPFYLRLVATMAVAAIMAELIAHSLGQRGEVLTIGPIGAIPAAVCSWLSSERQIGRTR